MKSIVIYDSAFGNTEKVAETIASILGAKVSKVAHIKKDDLVDLDLLVVGSPINGWRPLPSISNFLDSLEPRLLNNLKAATFDTRVKLIIHGDAKEKIAKALKKAGANVFSTEAFYVKGSEGPLLEGEIDKAKSFAESLIDKRN